MKSLLILVFVFASATMADEFVEPTTPVDRDPSSASTTSPSRRTYPGGADEEDLQVQAKLPEATLKTDYRSVQRGVYKTLYNQELKDTATEPVEE